MTSSTDIVLTVAGPSHFEFDTTNMIDRIVPQWFTDILLVVTAIGVTFVVCQTAFLLVEKWWTRWKGKDGCGKDERDERDE